MTESSPPSVNAIHPLIDDPSIAILVRTFYGRAREDDLIGPIFNAAVTDWDHHIGKISDFWSSIMRAGRRGLSRCRGDVTRSAFVLQASNGRAGAASPACRSACAATRDRSQRIVDI